MDTQRLSIRGRILEPDDPAIQDALSAVYETPERPRCLCVPGGVEMYIARHAEYVVKRMPETGRQHHPSCPSFEPEPGTSGLGELLGEAIIEHAPDQVEVRTDFAMSRMPGKSVSRSEVIADSAEVHAPRRTMSLRALLHFLYERAGFNRWYPAMEGRRNQGVLHKYLSEAAKGVRLKGTALDERLYVPEPFRAECKDQIGERRRKKLALLLSPEDAVHFKMAILVGEYNGSEATTFGRRIIVKHLPDVPLCIERKAWERVERNYGAILEARDADVMRRPRVMMAALIYAKREHVYQVDALSMMLTTDQWIPLEGLHELPLVEALQCEGRAFMKPLRYDARMAGAFPNVLLLDCGSVPLPIHVLSPFSDGKERVIKEKTVATKGESTWVWYTDKDMPPLPKRARNRVGGAGTVARSLALIKASACVGQGSATESVSRDADRSPS